MKVQEVIARAKGEKDYGMAGSRKNGGRDGLWKRRSVEKSKERTFPPRLEIPQTPRDSHFPHSLGDCGGLTKTGHFICYEKRDISKVVRKGTFLMSVDSPYF